MGQRLPKNITLTSLEEEEAVYQHLFQMVSDQSIVRELKKTFPNFKSVETKLSDKMRRFQENMCEELKTQYAVTSQALDQLRMQFPAVDWLRILTVVKVSKGDLKQAKLKLSKIQSESSGFQENLESLRARMAKIYPNLMPETIRQYVEGIHRTLYRKPAQNKSSELIYTFSSTDRQSSPSPLQLRYPGNNFAIPRPSTAVVRTKSGNKSYCSMKPDRISQESKDNTAPITERIKTECSSPINSRKKLPVWKTGLTPSRNSKNLLDKSRSKQSVNQTRTKKPEKKDTSVKERGTFLSHYNSSSSKRGPDAELVEMLEREVVSFDPKVNFADIADLERAKELLDEAVIMPLQMPEFFQGIRRPWKGVLMFGPPGTGKTMLAKAIASTGKTTFISVTASSLASKWKGDSEKLVRILFQMAKFYAPTTLFIDEIDSLASKRGQAQCQSSRKVKTQLFTQIDGISEDSSSDRKIVVIGATNRPWDLDEAIRRRMEKRIYIPLPTEQGRLQLFQLNLKGLLLAEDVKMQTLVKATAGYSGADITNLCRDAAFAPLRRRLKENRRSITNMKAFGNQVASLPLSQEDFAQALRAVRPSVNAEEIKAYEKWMRQYGESGTARKA